VIGRRIKRPTQEIGVDEEAEDVGGGEGEGGGSQTTTDREFSQRGEEKMPNVEKHRERTDCLFSAMKKNLNAY